MKRILVVCLVPDDRMIFKHFEFIKESLALEMGLKEIMWEVVRTKKQLEELIAKTKPQILIIDTHGRSRREYSDSVLQIGDSDVITNDDIVHHNIVAPIVILSSCYGSPLDGFYDPLPQGFFEAGARSVLASFLPVSMYTGALLYARILNNLVMSRFEV